MVDLEGKAGVTWTLKVLIIVADNVLTRDSSAGILLISLPTLFVVFALFASEPHDIDLAI